MWVLFNSSVVLVAKRNSHFLNPLSEDAKIVYQVKDSKKNPIGQIEVVTSGKHKLSYQATFSSNIATSAVANIATDRTNILLDELKNKVNDELKNKQRIVKEESIDTFGINFFLIHPKYEHSTIIKKFLNIDQFVKIKDQAPDILDIKLKYNYGNNKLLRLGIQEMVMSEQPFNPSKMKDNNNNFGKKISVFNVNISHQVNNFSEDKKSINEIGLVYKQIKKEIGDICES